MQDVLTRAKSLRRPKLLMTAARFMAREQSRNRLLTRILGAKDVWRPARTLVQLLDIEAGLNLQRSTQDASYRPSDHVRVLAAIVGEAAILIENRG